MKKKAFTLLALLLSAALLAACGEPAGTSSAEPFAESVSDVSVEASEIEISEVSEEPVDPLTRVWESAAILSDYDASYDAGGMFVYRSDLGLVLRKQDMEKPLFPASITKLVTALTALKYAEPDDVLTAGAELGFVEPDSTIAYIRKGHKLTVGMLIRGMLLPSGCDAAYVLAAGIGRRIDPEAADAEAAVGAFVEAMNLWSAENGLTGSHWCNPDGYHAEDHFTCMADLLRVADLAVSNAVVRDCASCGSADVVYASGESNHWDNTNLFVCKDSAFYDEHCIGLKTGTTDEAGACLLSVFEEDGVTTIIGVFGCVNKESRYTVTARLRQLYRLV